MIIFKCAIVILSSAYIFSLCYQIAQETNSLDTGLAFLYLASGVIVGKIIYDRYQHIHILGSLTSNPNVTLFANKIASISATLLFLGFLVYFFLFLFKVDDHCLRALSIFICGFGTLYIWTQCIITTYVSTLFYDQRLSLLRQCLANVSFLVLIVMAILGIVTSFISNVGSSSVYVCLLMTTLCGYLLSAIFCVFILSFEKDYQHFSEGLRSDVLLDDECSLDDTSCSDGDSIFGTYDLTGSTMVIKGAVSCAKLS